MSFNQPAPLPKSNQTVSTVSQELDRIRNENRNKSEKGRWSENLVLRVLETILSTISPKFIDGPIGHKGMNSPGTSIGLI